MKKKIVKWISFLILLSMMLINVSAMAAEQRLFDDAALFLAGQAANLEKRIADAKNETGLDIAIVTTRETNGKTSEEYADDFYDDAGLGSDSKYSGLLFLIDMDNREIYISTSGVAIDLLTDARIDAILDEAYVHMPVGDYYLAATAFLKETVYYIKQGMEEGQYRYDVETGRIIRPTSYYVMKFVAGLFIGAVIGGIVCLIIKAKYKVKFSKNQYVYKKNGSIRLTREDDVFINQTVIHRRIPEQTSSSGSSRSSGGSSSSGRSSVHHSSSGRTHGGGGRKF